MMTKKPFKNRLLPLSLLIILLNGCDDPVDFYLIDGSPHSLYEYRGQWLIINFWAEWCAPCREEIPELNLLANKDSEPRLEVIGVSYDPLTNEEIKQIAKKWEIKYPLMASQPNPILPFSLPKSLPGNYVISPNGELVLKLSGKQTAESISKLLKTLKNKAQ